MPYYRVTFDGYVEGEYESEDAAEEEMLRMMTEGDELREPRDFLSIETFNQETGEWE
jgi:hypothetical protein